MLDHDFIGYLNESLFLTDLQDGSKAELLEQMISPLLDQGIVKNKNVILETLKKRETLGSTGIGKGIAIPHCRTLAVSELTIVVGLSSTGVDYDSIDKKPVHLFFLIVAPPQEQVNQYLPFLGKLVEMLRNEKLRKTLTACSSFTEIMEVFQGDSHV